MKNLMKSASCGNPAKFVWQERPKEEIKSDSTKAEYKVPSAEEVEALKDKITNPKKQKEVEINKETADGVFEKMSLEQKQDFLEFLEENDKEWEEFSEEVKLKALSLYRDVAGVSGVRKLPDFMFNTVISEIMKKEMKYMKPAGVLGEDYKNMSDEEYREMVKYEELRKEEFNKLPLDEQARINKRNEEIHKSIMSEFDDKEWEGLSGKTKKEVLLENEKNKNSLNKKLEEFLNTVTLPKEELEKTIDTDKNYYERINEMEDKVALYDAIRNIFEKNTGFKLEEVPDEFLYDFLVKVILKLEDEEVLLSLNKGDKHQINKIKIYKGFRDVLDIEVNKREKLKENK